jgi:hypothetical protein
MQLDENYEIIELTQDEGVVVSKARDKKTGKLVQIHLFPNEKIPEASQICARLLSLPVEARSRVLKYGRDGSSTYFITEPLPEGQRLGEWVLREAAPRAATRSPEVNSGAVGSLRRMDIEPAALRPLPPGPEGRRSPAEPAPSPSPAPAVVHTGPRVRPMPPADIPAEPIAREPGGFYFPFTREEVNTARQPAPRAPSAPDSPAAANSSMKYTDVYGAEDLKITEPTGFPDTEPGTESLADKAGPGVNTFVGIPKEPLPPRGAPPASTGSTDPHPATGDPAEPSSERVSPPRSVARPVRQTVTFDVPAPHSPAQEPSDLFSPPPAPPPLPSAAVQPVVRQPAAPETRAAPAALFSMRIAALAALGLMAVAAIVALIVEIWG